MVAAAAPVPDKRFMQCYFQRDGYLAGVDMLPLGLSDEDAIARAHTLSSKRKRPFDGFEVWDRARFIFSLSPSAETLAADKPRARQRSRADDIPDKAMSAAWIKE